MWLFGRNGFLSIVQHTGDPDLLLVRARAKGDIEAYWPTAIVREGEGSDYRFRASLPRFEVVNAIAKAAHNINYPDFKQSLAGTDREVWYVDVWAIMLAMQNHLQMVERENGANAQAYSERILDRSSS